MGGMATKRLPVRPTRLLMDPRARDMLEDGSIGPDAITRAKEAAADRDLYRKRRQATARLPRKPRQRTSPLYTEAVEFLEENRDLLAPGCSFKHEILPRFITERGPLDGYTEESARSICGRARKKLRNR